jgi:photosystem II stability/assembly factor-like uncharacterized protein
MGVSGVLEQTRDAGRTWQRMVTPGVHWSYSEVQPGVSRVRFVDSKRGFLFAPDLYATVDNGRHWRRWPAPGAVEDLQQAGSWLYVIVSACRRTAAECAQRRVYRAPLGTARWRPVVSVNGDAVELIARGAHLYVAASRSTPSRLGTLAVSDGGQRWTTHPLPCGAWSVALAAWSDRGLVLVCGDQPGAGNQIKTAYRSLDAGASWQRIAQLPGSGGYVGALGTTNAHRWILTVTISDAPLVSADGGHTWTTASAVGAKRPVAADGLDQLQIIDERHAVALDDALPSGGLLLTSDAGRTWRAVYLNQRLWS